MDLQSITLFKMADKRMQWANQRQRIVTQNIANADTPKYTPSELKPLDFSKELRSNKTAMTVTDPKHRTASSVNVSLTTTKNDHIASSYGPEVFRSYKNRRSYENSLDRNGVVLEEEGLKLSENRDMHDRAATIYQKYNTMLQSSLGKN